MNYAPIVLFTYNRPWHTRQTVETLQKNHLAKDSDLIVFSDAPKNPQAEQSVNEVREYLKTITGFKSIKIIEREQNFGLAKSIITGVTDIVNQYGRIIVLEDDLVTSPYFLNYMNDSLEVYKDDNKVMHISGYNYPINQKNLPETYFVRPDTCWSWATWDRAWKYYRKDANYYLEIFDKEMIKDFNLNGAYDYFDQIKKNANGELNTWAIFWYASIYLNNGLSLHPTRSFAQNIGHDNSGENCGQDDSFNTQLIENYEGFPKIDLVESKLGRARMEAYFNSIKPKLYKRVIRKFIKVIRRS